MAPLTCPAGTRPKVAALLEPAGSRRRLLFVCGCANHVPRSMKRRRSLRLPRGLGCKQKRQLKRQQKRSALSARRSRPRPLRRLLPLLPPLIVLMKTGKRPLSRRTRMSRITGTPIPTRTPRRRPRPRPARQQPRLRTGRPREMKILIMRRKTRIHQRTRRRPRPNSPRPRGKRRPLSAEKRRISRP